MIRVAVDTGGTFTDFVVASDRDVRFFKTPSTPRRPAEALLQGLARISKQRGPNSEFGYHLLHGTTVATNAILEGTLAKTAFITNDGFRDLIFLARQTRPELYSLEPVLPKPPLEREDCFTVRGRLLPDGSELEALCEEDVAAVARQAAGYEAVAVCFLFGYANPDHEMRVAEAICRHGGISRSGGELFVSCSHQVSPEFREYERACSTLLNAALGPLMRFYITEIAAGSGAEQTLMMSSSGGLTAVDDALALPIRTVTSGPAAGVAAAHDLAKRLSRERVIAFDMGGTSTDVSLIAGAPSFTHLGDIGGLPVRGHRVDVHTIGCGGGSLARLDEAGALRVGPQSAGADPGPAVYGKGDLFTVTDANCLLGRLPAERFGAGTGIRLDTARAERVADAFASAFGRSAVETAEGVLQVAEAMMARAVRRVSSARGHDPADFSLLCYGGAGGLHACAIAEELGIREVLVPLAPGTFSALGLLLAPRIREESLTVLGAMGPSDWEAVYSELGSRARVGLGVAADRAIRLAEMRYKGQSHEIAVPAPSAYADACADFERLHLDRYGVLQPGAGVEWITARVRLEIDPPALPPECGYDGPVESSIPQKASVRLGGRWTDARLVGRESMLPGSSHEGPAIVLQADSTTLLPAGWHAHALEDGTLSLTRAA